MTPAERFTVCEELFETLIVPWIGTPEWRKFEELRWQEKLRIRNKMVQAFRKLDEYRSERQTDQPAR